MGAKRVVKMNNLSFPLVELFLCHFNDVSSKFCLILPIVRTNKQPEYSGMFDCFLALSNFTDAIGRLIKTHYLLGDHVFHIHYGLDEMPLL
jgi:hypothetical protein